MEAKGKAAELKRDRRNTRQRRKQARHVQRVGQKETEKER